MDKQKFQQIVGVQSRKFKDKQFEKVSASIKPLAELLIKFYERLQAEEEVKKYDKSQ